MYVIVPNEQYHSDRTSSYTHAYSTFIPNINAEMSPKQKCAVIAKMANDKNRGAILTTNEDEAVDLAVKYGGVVTNLRTGETIYTQFKGIALHEFTFKSSIYPGKGYNEVSGETTCGIRIQYRVMHNGLELLFAKHVTDLPEVVALLGQKHYIKI